MNDLLYKHPLLRKCEPHFETIYGILAIAIEGNVQRIWIRKRHNSDSIFVHIAGERIVCPPYDPRIMLILREMVCVVRKNPASAFDCNSCENSTEEEFALTVAYLPGYDVHEELRQIMEKINSDQEDRKHKSRRAYTEREYEKYRWIAVIVLIVAAVLAIAASYSQQ